MEEKESRLVMEAIQDINDVLSGIDWIKEGLGLRGQSRIEDSLDSAKQRLRRALLYSIGEA